MEIIGVHHVSWDLSLNSSLHITQRENQRYSRKIRPKFLRHFPSFVSSPLQSGMAYLAVVIYPWNKNKFWMDFQGVSVITIIVIYNYCNSYKYKWLTINKYITKNFNEHMTLKNTFKSKEPFPKFQSATRGPYIDEITEHVPSRSKITRKSADLDSLDEVSQPICASRWPEQLLS